MACTNFTASRIKILTLGQILPHALIFPTNLVQEDIGRACEHTIPVSVNLTLLSRFEVELHVRLTVLKVCLRHTLVADTEYEHPTATAPCI